MPNLYVMQALSSHSLLYLARGSLSQCLQMQIGSCDQIRTQDFLVAPTAIIEYSSRLNDCGHRGRISHFQNETKTAGPLCYAYRRHLESRDIGKRRQKLGVMRYPYQGYVYKIVCIQQMRQGRHRFSFLPKILKEVTKLIKNLKRFFQYNQCAGSLKI